MTDRELLELAARAVGIEGHWSEHSFAQGIVTSTINSVDTPWNPLRNDGQALRLAVKLGISECEPVRICIEYQHDGEQAFTCVEHHGEHTQFHSDDPYAATRRAIVRSAAKLGETK